MNHSKVAKFVLQNGSIYDKVKKDVSEITSTHLFEAISYKTYNQIEREIREVLDSYVEQQLINDYEFDLGLNLTDCSVKIF